MQTKLLKIPMNPNSKARTKDLINYMQSNIGYPKEEMEQKGYFWDSIFYADEGTKEYLYIVIKSEDFSKIMLDESELIATPFRAIYEQYRKECWTDEPYTDIEPIHCFNRVLVFG